MSSGRTILIGAGTSIEAGVPGTKAMARVIYERLPRESSEKKAIDAAIGGLRFQRALAEGDAFADIDIEDLYEVLRALSKRNSSFLAPFVGSWSSSVATAEAAEGEAAVERVVDMLASDLRAIVRQAVPAAGKQPTISVDGSDLYSFREALQQALQLSVGQGSSVFKSAASQVLVDLVNLCWIRDKTAVAYLERLVRAGTTTEPIWIASLNYDNAIELAAANCGLEVDLGVRDREPALQFRRDSRICLAKLHGSIDWMIGSDGDFRIATKPEYGEWVLVFGSGNKLSIRGPYLDLLFAFRERLETSNHLEVCGYSFRDEHVNYIIVQWLDRHRDREITVFDPEMTPERVARNVANSLHISERSFIERLRVEPLKASEWTARF